MLDVEATDAVHGHGREVEEWYQTSHWAPGKKSMWNFFLSNFPLVTVPLKNLITPLSETMSVSVLLRCVLVAKRHVCLSLHELEPLFCLHSFWKQLSLSFPVLIRSQWWRLYSMFCNDFTHVCVSVSPPATILEALTSSDSTPAHMREWIEQGFSQKHIDSPSLAALTLSSLCVINASPRFGLPCSCAGCIQGEACRSASIHNEVYTPPWLLYSRAVVRGGQLQGHSVVKFHFTLCVSIDFYWSLDKISQDIVKRPSPPCTQCLEKDRNSVR